MSKYSEQGAYHYKLFKTKGDPYRLHVLDVNEKVMSWLRPEARILDVGCGEGLIVRTLISRGYNAIGIDTDPEAVALAIGKKNPVILTTIEDLSCAQPGEHKPDAILMLDVLEHVEDLEGTIIAAQRMADLHFVAVPDRNDPGALRQLIADQVADIYTGWECLHSETRNARVFMVFRKTDEFYGIGTVDEAKEAGG